MNDKHRAEQTRIIRTHDVSKSSLYDNPEYKANVQATRDDLMERLAAAQIRYDAWLKEATR